MDRRKKENIFLWGVLSSLIIYLISSISVQVVVLFLALLGVLVLSWDKLKSYKTLNFNNILITLVVIFLILIGGYVILLFGGLIAILAILLKKSNINWQIETVIWALAALGIIVAVVDLSSTGPSGFDMSGIFTLFITLPLLVGLNILVFLYILLYGKKNPKK